MICSIQKISWTGKENALGAGIAIFKLRYPLNEGTYDKVVYQIKFYTSDDLLDQISCNFIQRSSFLVKANMMTQELDLIFYEFLPAAAVVIIRNFEKPLP